jgi:hypothetical protein
MINIFNYSHDFRNNHFSLMKYIHEDTNAHLHLKLERKMPIKKTQVIVKIISQGVEEGFFETKYPEDAAQAFIGLSTVIMQDIYTMDKNTEQFNNKLLAVFYFTEKILDAKKGLLLTYYNKKGEYNK